MKTKNKMKGKIENKNKINKTKSIVHNCQLGS